MGELAEDCLDLVIEAEAEIENQIAEILESDDQSLIESVEELMSSADYRKNSYTRLVKNIIKSFSLNAELSKKQRYCLARHLAENGV